MTISSPETDSGQQRRPRRFKSRHLSMMALGSAIGAGFFLGTGVAVSEAGPGVFISYLLASFIAVSVMYALAEMASALPSTGSFSSYAEAGIGRWAGFTVGWLYWFMLIRVLGMEITGAASIFSSWFPSVPQWTVALVIVIIFGGINLMAAGNFGEVEAWLAGIKVAAIVVFMLISIALIAGIFPGREAGVTDVFSFGILPTGFAGVATALLAILTSFGGIEIITIAAAEAENPQQAMGHAIRSVIFRILVFYVGSVFLLICLLPWNSAEMATNPFASVLEMAGLPAVGRIMEAIVFMALISAFSANVYASSRMSYSLSARGMGFTLLTGGEVISHGLTEKSIDGSTGELLERTPRRAVALSIVLSLVSVGLNWWLPESILMILINAIGMALVIVWVFIIVSQIRLHRRLEESGQLTIRMPGWPYLPWIILVAFGAVALLMASNEAARSQLISMTALTAIIVAIYFVREKFICRHR